MMIKKKLGLLAGAVVLASGANAATLSDLPDDNPGGTDGSLMLALINANGTFVIDLTGAGVSSAASLQGGTGFSADIAAIAAADGNAAGLASFGGAASATSYALFANRAQDGAYVSSAYDNQDPNLGVVYARSGAGNVLANWGQLSSAMNDLNAYVTKANNAGLSGGNTAFVADTLAGDFDEESPLFGGLINSVGATQEIYFQQSDPAGFRATDDLVQNQVSFASGNQLAEYNGAALNVSAVPVPAAAWLFGSALLGLGVMRRRA